MRAYLLIALGAVLGANARYLVSRWAAGRWPATFPYGTLLVNVTGSFLLGALSTLLAGWAGGADARLLLGTGFCGAYTTFSTFSYETLALARQRARLPAVANVLGNTLLCIGAATLGALLGGVPR